MLDAEAKIELYRNDNDPTAKSMLEVYQAEKDLLGKVWPKLEQLRELAQAGDIKAGLSILKQQIFKDFHRFDLGMEVAEHALTPNEEALQLYSECTQLMDDAALTMTGVTQCMSKLKDNQMAALMQMQPGQLQAARTRFQTRAQKSAVSSISYAKERASKAQDAESYEAADLYEASRFAPVALSIQNGESHASMGKSIESMINSLTEKIYEKENVIRDKRYAVEYVNPQLFQERDMLIKIQEFLQSAKQAAEIPTTASSRATGHAFKSQEAMSPVWAFLTWSIAAQNEFQEPIVSAISTVVSEAASKQMRIETFADTEKGRASAFESFRSIPYFDDPTDAQKALDILLQPFDGKRDAYVRVLEFTLQSAFKKVLKNRDERFERLKELMPELFVDGEWSWTKAMGLTLAQPPPLQPPSPPYIPSPPPVPPLYIPNSSPSAPPMSALMPPEMEADSSMPPGGFETPSNVAVVEPSPLAEPNSEENAESLPFNM